MIISDIFISYFQCNKRRRASCRHLYWCRSSSNHGHWIINSSFSWIKWGWRMGKFTEKVFILVHLILFLINFGLLWTIRRSTELKLLYIFIATSRLSRNRSKSILLQTQLVVSQDKTPGSFYVSQLGQTCHGLDLSSAKLLHLFGIGAQIRLVKIDSHNCQIKKWDYSKLTK